MKKHPAAIIAAILVTAAIAAAAAVAGVMIHDLSKGDSDSTDIPTWREQYDLGVRYLRSGNYEEAVIAFKAAIEIDPKKADAYLGLVDAYIGLGDMEKAEEVLTDALDAVRSSDRADIEAKLAELDSTAPKGPPPEDPNSTESSEPEHTHTWLDATCTEPRTCSECGATEGDPLGHDMLPATTEAPATCVRCGYTEGEPLASEITWTFNNGTLTISGNGRLLNDYSWGETSWYEVSNDIIQVIIEDGVTAIWSEVFFGCDNLTRVTIPSSVTWIDDAAFLGCDSLAAIDVDNGSQSFASVDGVLFNTDMTVLHTYPAGKSGNSYTIPSGVTAIGDREFSNCSNLTAVTIPSSVTRIGYAAFSYCDSLASVTIPDSVTTIGESTFMLCNSTINADNGNKNYVSVDGVLFSKDMTLLYAYPAGKDITEYIVPDSVKEIGHGAFSGCFNLTSIIISNSVSKIGSEAFTACHNITSITIPNSVSVIGNYAFSYCDNLTSITISDSVSEMGFNVFGDCNDLADIYYGGSPEQWATLTANTVIPIIPETATIHYHSH